MASNKLTEIAAINILLASVAQSPISSLVAPLTGTVALAKNILDEVRREVLAEGWAFNSDRELVMQPDAISNQIALSDTILRVDGSPERNSSMDLTERAGKLYDKVAQTFTFTSDVYVDVIYHQEFTDIPDVARNYIAKRAARVLVDRTFNEATSSQMFRQEEFEARVKLKKHESDVGDYNILSGNNFVYKMLNRRSPFWR